MNRKIIKDELQWLLEVINEQYDILKSYEDKAPQIEFDILMDNIRKFYEKMMILQKIQGGALSGKLTTERPAVKTPQTSSEKKEEILREPRKEPVVPEISVRYEKPAPVNQEVPSTPVKEKPVREHQSPARKTVKPADGDLFSGDEPAFTIRLKEAREKTFGPKSGSLTRGDLIRNSININDKFMFVNELFDGNLRDYNEIFASIGEMNSFSEVSSYFEILQKKHYWDTASPAFRKLRNLVERQF
jgi:hypothetical protein